MLLHCIKNFENLQKEVDDIQIEVDGGCDVFLWGEFVDEHVGVKDDEARE